MGSYTVLLAKLISKELLALRRRLSLTQEAWPSIFTSHAVRMAIWSVENTQSLLPH